MIAKNIKGKSFGGCVRYVLNDRHELLEAEGVLADSAESIIRSFAMQWSARNEIAKPVGHIPISFASEDKGRMTNDFMVQLAKEYMKEMGIGNTQYIVVRHHNTDNDHLHIVYNRIDNDLKLISVNNDYKRNIEVCKKLKDKHNLTYGENKDRVKREKLSNPDKAKYQIYDAVVEILPYCKSENDLKNLLRQSGIEAEFKLSRTTGEVQGISFRCGNVSFKGSEVDREFSFGNLKKEFDKNLELYNKKLKDFDIRRFLPDDLPKKERRDEPEIVRSSVKESQQPITERPKIAQAQPSAPCTTIPQEPSAKSLPVKRKYVVNGVELTDGQTRTLLEGGHIFLENMTPKDGIGELSAFVFLCDEKKKIFYSYDDPDKFVRYGKWEMRVRDKQQIEAGHITRAKIKYWGGGFAHPYLWKPGVVDEGSAGVKVIPELASGNEYRGSWGDPRKVAAAAKNEPDNNDRQKQVQTSQTTLETVTITARTVGRTGVETLADTASAIGSLFDINPNTNNPTEDPDQLQPLKRKKQKKKKQGRSM